MKRKKLRSGELADVCATFYQIAEIEQSAKINEALRSVVLNYSVPRAKKVEEEKSFVKTTGEQITPDMISAAVSLFQPFFPHDFIEMKAYASRPIRLVVTKVLETVSINELNTMIQQYFVIRKNDAFRPSVGSIHEFCTTKFAKVKDFLERKNGNNRYGLDNIPGETKGAFNEKHKDKLNKLTADRERVNKRFREEMGLDK